jgi:hypothetical protein
VNKIKLTIDRSLKLVKARGERFLVEILTQPFLRFEIQWISEPFNPPQIKYTAKVNTKRRREERESNNNTTIHLTRSIIYRNHQDQTIQPYAVQHSIHKLHSYKR